jgi:hypothetical protein
MGYHMKFLRTLGLLCSLLLGGAPALAQTYPGTQQPWFLTGGITLFVDGSAGNDNNSGMAAGAGNAWATFAPAYKFLCQRTNGNGFAATISVANASSIAGSNFALTCTPLGYSLIILNLGGGTLTPASGVSAVLLAAPIEGNGYGFSALHVTNGTLTCSGGGNGLQVTAGTAVIESVDGTVTFGTCTGGSHVEADGSGSRVFLKTGYTISGNAAQHITAIASAGIDYNTAATITCSGSPAFTTFALAQIGGWIVLPTGTVAFSSCGTVTGARYSATVNGSIYTNAGGASFFPGNSPGSMASGGRYDSPGTPTINPGSCGTSPGATAGTDMSGSAVEGTAAAGCTILFTTNNAPKSCTVNLSTANVVGLATLNSIGIVVSHVSVSGNTLYWNCPAN